MPRKQVLIAGASGLVGYAAMRHFGADPDCDVIALSRRAPDDTHGARFLALDLTDAAACERLATSLPGVTHLVYAALYERPGLIAGWRELTGQRAVFGGEALNATFGPVISPPTNSAINTAAASKLPATIAKKPMLRLG